MHQQVAHRQGAHREHRDGRVALQAGPLAPPQQQDGRRHRDRQHQQHLVGELEHRGDGQRPEGHVGQAVADEGEPLEHQRDPEQGGAQGDEHPHHQRVAHKGEGEVVLQGLEGCHGWSPPFRESSWRARGANICPTGLSR